MNNIFVGMILGMLFYQVCIYAGEARYSDAIRICIKNLGPNK